MANMDAGTVVVPPLLKKLAEHVLLAFYDPPCIVVVGILQRYQCVKETDIAAVLRLDKKLVRAALMRLRSDKIVKMRPLRDPTLPKEDLDAEKEFDYWCMDYEQLVNTTRYRLHIMRDLLQRDSKTESSGDQCYSCRSCRGKFSDMDTRSFRINHMTGAMLCPTCDIELE